MWLFTTFGFFSIVQKPGQRHLCIRARSAADLDRLRARYLPALGPIETGTGTDYPHRAHVPRVSRLGWGDHVEFGRSVHAIRS